MSRNRLKLTIGLPVYQGERYLALALDSILAQSFGEFELIISDNHSTDATQDISRQYASRDKRIRYVRNSFNIGVAKNFNQCFQLSNGQYFRWAAYDDILEPAYLKECVALLDADASAVIGHSRTWRIDAEGKRLGPLDEQPHIRSAQVAERFEAIVRLGEYHSVWGVMRSEAVKRTRMHGTYRSSDFVFLTELAVQGRFAFTDDYLFNLREHAEQYTGNDWSPQVQAEWWGSQSAGWKYMEAPTVYGQELVAALRSELPWDQKMACSRIVLGCVAQFTTAIARRWMNRTTGLFHKRPRENHATTVASTEAPAEVSNDEVSTLETHSQHG